MAQQIDAGDDSAFDMGFNSKTFGIPYYGANFNMDMADVQMWIGTQTDFSIEANRRLFIDASGKPVDPAVATAALGQQTVLMSGDKDTFGINQGSGGSFDSTGTLTNATTSPSD